MTDDEVATSFQEASVRGEEGEERVHEGGKVVIFAVVRDLGKQLEISSDDLLRRIGKSLKERREGSVVDCKHLYKQQM